MRILGIDCGAVITGYGVVDSDGRRHELVTSGVIRTSPKNPLALRLQQIHSGLENVVRENHPDSVAVENVFYAVNVQMSLKLAHVRGVALLAAAEADLEVAEYSPLEIKSSVVGYGRATKSQVQMMVSSLLRRSDSIQPFDASDALAVALCHAFTQVTKRKLVSRGPAHV